MCTETQVPSSGRELLHALRTRCRREAGGKRGGKGYTNRQKNAACIHYSRGVMRPTFIGQLATSRRQSELFAGPSRSLVSLFQFGSDCTRPLRPPPPSLRRFHSAGPPASSASSRFLAPSGRFIKPTRNSPLLSPEEKRIV